MSKVSEPVKPEAKKGTTLIEKETVETGSVKLSVYWYYMKVCLSFYIP